MLCTSPELFVPDKAWKITCSMESLTQWTKPWPTLINDKPQHTSFIINDFLTRYLAKPAKCWARQHRRNAALERGNKQTEVKHRVSGYFCLLWKRWKRIGMETSREQESALKLPFPKHGIPQPSEEELALSWLCVTTVLIHLSGCASRPAEAVGARSPALWCHRDPACT